MQQHKQSIIGIGFKAVVFCLAVWIALISMLGALDPQNQSGIFRRLMTSVPWAGYVHVYCGSIALIVGGIQMSVWIRRRQMTLHKICGRLYVVCVLISAVGSIATLLETTTAWPAKSGFWLLAFAWPITTLAAVPWTGRFDIRRHGKLMVYSYAMTCAAITLRLYLGGLMSAGVPYQTAYPIAAWGGGLGNLVIAYFALRYSNRNTNGVSKLQAKSA